MEYHVKTVLTCNWEGVEKAKIDQYVWDTTYTPEAYAQMLFIEKEGLFVKLTCVEKNPKANYTHSFEPVYKDSCLEFFAAFHPQKKDYINCEMNANGTLLMEFGDSRYGRTLINAILSEIPSIQVEKDPTSWSVTLFLCKEAIKTIFDVELKRGCHFKGNFYKCGDETETEHYGMWSPVKTLLPDFHRPDYFADFFIE